MAKLENVFNAAEHRQIFVVDYKSFRDELRYNLRALIQELAVKLYGEPHRQMSTKRDLRFGNKGSLSVAIDGPRKGSWHTFEGGEHGDAIALIERALRCSFREAVAYGLRFVGMPDYFAGALDHRSPARIEADRLAREAERDAAAEASAETLAREQAGRIDYARRIAGEAVPLAGTLGEVYLTLDRRIPMPSGCWPDAIRYHVARRSLVAVATAADGSVCAVQLVHLAEAGTKEERNGVTKRSHGPVSAGLCRLPGAGDGPLLMAEGPETGLAAWSSTGFETWIMLGGFRVVPCAGL